MNAAAQITSDKIRSAYLDLEEPIRELACMAVIARFYMLETNLPAGISEREKDELERAAFAISHIARMAESLNEAWHAGWDNNPVPDPHRVRGLFLTLREWVRPPCRTGALFRPRAGGLRGDLSVVDHDLIGGPWSGP